MMWIPASAYSWQNYPSVYADWLQNPGSLTQRFRELSQDQLKHDLFFEGWKNLSESELEPLKISSNTALNTVWCREIVFFGQNQPWEWARTIIPQSSLVGEGAALMNLGNKPIGDVLFTDPHLQRSEFEIAQLNYEHPYTQEVNTLLNIDANNIWARRSIIYFHQKPLLIYELFLPAVFSVILNTII